MKMENVSLRSTKMSVEEIMSYRNDRLLKRYREDFGASTEEAERCFKALKEFMVICAVKPGYKVTSDPIDKMWHTFLLFTKDYYDFCENSLGIFIDHEPFETAAPWAYLETRTFAKSFFGDLDEKLWSPDAKADCSSGCGT